MIECFCFPFDIALNNVPIYCASDFFEPCWRGHRISVRNVAFITAIFVEFLTAYISFSHLRLSADQLLLWRLNQLSRNPFYRSVVQFFTFFLFRKVLFRAVGVAQRLNQTLQKQNTGVCFVSKWKSNFWHLRIFHRVITSSFSFILTSVSDCMKKSFDENLRRWGSVTQQLMQVDALIAARTRRETGLR